MNKFCPSHSLLGSMLKIREPNILFTSVVDDFSAQDGSHLQHSDEGLVHGSEGEGGHAVSPGHLGDVHCTVTWEAM